MRIEINKNSFTEVTIITFHTHGSRFESDYERSKFFRQLHGWKQTVPRNGKQYSYHRKGLLDEVPHVKIADSTFMIMNNELEKVLEYFDQWEQKVEYKILKAMIHADKFKRLAHKLINNSAKYMSDR